MYLAYDNAEISVGRICSVTVHGSRRLQPDPAPAFAARQEGGDRQVEERRGRHHDRRDDRNRSVNFVDRLNEGRL